MMNDARKKKKKRGKKRRKYSFFYTRNFWLGEAQIVMGVKILTNNYYALTQKREQTNTLFAHINKQNEITLSLRVINKSRHYFNFI
jgi:hypothetical protein